MDDQGAYLLDCDHRYFRIVLNYLRYNELMLDGNCTREGLLVVAKYFQVRGLIDLLDNSGASLLLSSVTVM